MQLTPFHPAIQLRDLDEARNFYGRQLEFPEGRSFSEWVDFNMFGIRDYRLSIETQSLGFGPI